MAKLYKATVYICDNIDGIENEEDCANYVNILLEQGELFLPINPIVEASDAFEWNDDIDLNQEDCSIVECENYFKKDVVE